MSTALTEDPTQEFNPDLAPLVANLLTLRTALSQRIATLPESSAVRGDLECIRHDSINPALDALCRLAGCRDGLPTF